MIENDEIVSYKADSLLNKRNELVGTCKHILIYKLVNFDPTGRCHCLVKIPLHDYACITSNSRCKICLVED